MGSMYNMIQISRAVYVRDVASVLIKADQVQEGHEEAKVAEHVAEVPEHDLWPFFDFREGTASAGESVSLLLAHGGLTS